MALSIREQIMVALTELLAAVTDMDATRVRRNEPFATEAQAAPILILRDGPATLDDSNSGVWQWTARPTIEGQVWASDDDDAATTCNKLMADVLAALADDPTLGGLAVDVRVTETDYAEDDETGNRIAAFSLALELLFWTKTTDVTALGPN